MQVAETNTAKGALWAHVALFDSSRSDANQARFDLGQLLQDLDDNEQELQLQKMLRAQLLADIDKKHPEKICSVLEALTEITGIKTPLTMGTMGIKTTADIAKVHTPRFCALIAHSLHECSAWPVIPGN